MTSLIKLHYSKAGDDVHERSVCKRRTWLSFSWKIIPRHSLNDCLQEQHSQIWLFDYLIISGIVLSQKTMEALGKQGWRSGESGRFPPIWPGFNSRSRGHMWVEFGVGSRPCSKRFFSGYSGFPLAPKTNISVSQLDLEPESHRFVSLRLLGVTLVKRSWLIDWLFDWLID